MKINSAEVARKAGVSRSTVSRVINNNPNVIESTRQKVLKVIEALNYTPNTNAQTLAGKKSSVIGLFIVEDNSSPNMRSSLIGYFMNFVSSVGAEVLHHNHQLLIDVVYDQIGERRVKSLFLNGNISGGIFIGSSMNKQFIDDFITSDNKVALIDYSTSKNLINDNVSLINTNDYIASKEITEELIRMGCRRILHITGNQNKLPGLQRLKGYKQAIKNSDLTPDPRLIIAGDFTEEAGYRAVIKCIEENIEFDSIFAANDLMARAAKRALEEHNLPQVPLWGYDNLQGSLPTGIMSADPCFEISAVKAVKSILHPDDESRRIQYTPVKLVKNMDDYLQCFRASREFFTPERKYE